MERKVITLREYLESYSGTPECYKAGSLFEQVKGTREQRKTAELWSIPVWMLEQRSSLFTRLQKGG